MTILKSGEGVVSPLKYFEIKVVRFVPVAVEGQIGVDPFLRGVLPTPEDGILLPATINRILITTDATPGECSIALNNPSTTHYKQSASGLRTYNDDFELPNIGDGICIFISPVEGEEHIAFNEFKLIFKGYIVDSTIHRGDHGSQYVFNCHDMKLRLSEQVIRKNYNETYNTSSFPNYSEKMKETSPYMSEEWTVEQIIEDIMELSQNVLVNTPSQNLVYFNYASFDFNGMTELKDFVPKTLSFENISVLEAIYRTISSAGSYRMVYNPITDKICFIRISIDASNCGPQITLEYGDEANPNTSYAEDVNVISDNTIRRTSELANIYRMYSAPIEWYSGHFVIKEFQREYQIENDTFGGGTGELGEEKESPIHYLPDMNWDGYQYIYGFSKALSENSALQQLGAVKVVGCPLYPSWDVCSGYEAYETNIKQAKACEFDSKMQMKKSTLTDIVLPENQANYEVQGFTVNDKKFNRDRSLDNAVGDNSFNDAAGFSYEAWIPYPDKCRFCNGTGAVEDHNVSTVAVFGKTISESMQRLNPVGVSGLTAFNYQIEHVEIKDSRTGIRSHEYIPRRHPVPWKNTCPVCRGVGMEPWFRITNILSNLVDVPPNELKLGSQIIQSKTDRTWGEIVRDLSYNYGTDVQMETALEIVALQRNSDNNAEVPYHSIADLNSKLLSTGAPVFANPEDKKIDKIYYTQISKAEGFNIDSERGLVVFNDRQYIPCKKPIRTLMYDGFDKDRFLVKDKDRGNISVYNGMGTVGGVNYKARSFWRPARAWITCYFNRNKLYQKISNSTKEIRRKIIMDGSDVITSYSVGASIEDNRFCVEMTKSSDGGAEEFTARPVIKGETMDSMRWQIHPWDVKKWAIPDGLEDSAYDIVVPNEQKDPWLNLVERLQAKKYYYPEGMLLAMEPLRESEATSLGVDLSQVLKSDYRGKLIRWVHKDKRIKLLEKGTMELERRNDIQITGSVEIRGRDFDLTTGIGYVVFPDNKKACVVKAEYKFDGAFSIDLEVGTEDFRIGEDKEEDLDYKRMVDEKINQLYRNNNRDKKESKMTSRIDASPSSVVGDGSIRRI